MPRKPLAARDRPPRLGDVLTFGDGGATARVIERPANYPVAVEGALFWLRSDLTGVWAVQANAAWYYRYKERADGGDVTKEG